MASLLAWIVSELLGLRASPFPFDREGNPQLGAQTPVLLQIEENTRHSVPLLKQRLKQFPFYSEGRDPEVDQEDLGNKGSLVRNESIEELLCRGFLG